MLTIDYPLNSHFCCFFTYVGSPLSIRGRDLGKGLYPLVASLFNALAGFKGHGSEVKGERSTSRGTGLLGVQPIPCYTKERFFR